MKIKDNEGNIEIAEMLSLQKYINSKEEEEWYSECYPTLKEYRDAYFLPRNFPFNYEHGTYIHFMFNNPKDVPIQHERVSVAKLRFNLDWNWIMKAVEFINIQHNDNLPARDLAYTMNYLLNGGFKFGSNKKLEWLPMSLENLFQRVSLYAINYNKNKIVKNNETKN